MQWTCFKFTKQSRDIFFHYFSDTFKLAQNVQDLKYLDYPHHAINDHNTSQSRSAIKYPYT